MINKITFGTISKFKVIIFILGSVKLTALFVNFLYSEKLLWQCNSFPIGYPFAGECNWGRTNKKTINIASVKDPSGETNKYVVRIFYPKGSYAGNRTITGGTEFNAHPFGNSDHIRFSYQLYFSSNFDFVLGGKLPGLYGGNGLCAGGTKYSNGNHCFSTRFMWREKGALELYVYLPNEKGKWFCKHQNVNCSSMFGYSFGMRSAYFQRGRWHTIAQDIKLNDPGKANAVMKMMFDDKQVYEISGLTMRYNDSMTIDTLMFSTFFGGSSSPKFAATDDVYIYFRQFQIYAM